MVPTLLHRRFVYAIIPFQTSKHLNKEPHFSNLTYSHCRTKKIKLWQKIKMAETWITFIDDVHPI
jgi:hypothetical protein